MTIGIHLASKVVIPRESIDRLTPSCPFADRLAQCNAWAGLDRKSLGAAVRTAGWPICRLRPVDFNQEVDALHAKLQTLATDPVWLVPSVVDAKLSYVDHLRPLHSTSARSLLGIGFRDSYQNLFKFLFQRGQSPATLCRPCEPLVRRQYATLFCRTAEPGRLRGGQATFSPYSVSVLGQPDDVEFAFVATPLVEAGVVTPIEKRVGSQSDLRHEFRISPLRWKTDLPALQALLFTSDPAAAIGERILHEARRRGLHPEDGYYLSSVGVRENGDLILISQHSSVSALAQAQVEAGADYALLVEEGGSCGTAIWNNARDFSLPDPVKRDANGSVVWQPEPVIFGNNSYFRPNALAMCVVELKDFFLEAPFIE